MKCPNCQTELETINYKNIPVDACPSCQGMWLNFNELDTLEDTVLSEDELKGTLVWDKQPSERKCPECGKKMTSFNYRLNDIHLEYCEDMHGYWLDKGEEEKVITEMNERSESMEKKIETEDNWAKHLKRLQSPSFFNKLTDLLK